MASRKPKQKTRAKKAEVTVVEPEGVEQVDSGMGLEAGISITTFLCLAGALALVIMALDRYPS